MVVTEHGDQLDRHAQRGERGRGARGAAGRDAGVGLLDHRHRAVPPDAVRGPADPAVEDGVADDEHPGRLAGDARGHLQRVGTGHGHEGSTDGVMMSSRTSQPAGLRQRVQHGVGHVGRVVEHRASGPGLYCSVRPSKKAVSMPPGRSRVTPTSPASSVASARVMPTTPNLDAQ